jgi:hypothetical protein
MSAPQTTGFAVDSPIKFDKVLSGNMIMNTATYKMNLKANKTYKIDVNLVDIHTNAYMCMYRLKNMTKGEYIGEGFISVPQTSASNYNTQSGISTIYTPTADCEIALVVVNNPTYISSVESATTNIVIQEIAQPVVVEYHKEFSNPLTTTPLEYGEFGITADVATGQTVPIVFNKVISGNMRLSAGGVHLTAGKTYELSADTYWGSSAQLYSVWFYNVTKAQQIAPAGVPTAGLGAATFFTPTEDCDVSIIVFTAVTVVALYTKITAKEVRSNPVNQYGGFETKILFDGTAKTYGNYTLTDNVTNYDFIIVEWDLYYQGVIARGMSDIFSRYIAVNKPCGMSYYQYSNMGVSVCLQFSGNILNLIQTWQSTFTFEGIKRVLGVKGQLPTLLTGGVF